MLKKLSHIILSNICIAVSLTSCDPSSLNEAECNDGKVPIGLSALISQEYVTRADSHGFTDGDVISTYIVDYENGMPGQLKDKGLTIYSILSMSRATGGYQHTMCITRMIRQQLTSMHITLHQILNLFLSLNLK